MKFTKIRLFAAVGAAVLAGLMPAARADESLPVPKEWVHGFINGYFSVMTYAYDGDTALQVEVQMKRAGEDDSQYVQKFLGVGTCNQYTYDGQRDPFRLTLDTGLTGAPYKDNHPLREQRFAATELGAFVLRMRANNGTDTSAWVELGESTNYLNVTGTRYQNGAVTGDAKLYDGWLQTMIDANGDPWTGMNLGRPMKIRGIRYYSRGDLSFSRIYGSKFEYGSDIAFTDARDAFVISNGLNCSSRRITEVWFDEPFTAQCIRHVSSTGGRCSLCDYEIIPAELPYTAAITCEYDSDHCTPKIGWSAPEAAMATRGRVLRCDTEAGEYEDISGWVENSAGFYTDTGALTGVLYYYKVEIECNHPQFPAPGNTMVSEARSLRAVRRLDRDPSDEAHLLPGLTLVNSSFAAAFDGDVGTQPNTYAPIDVGPCGIKFTNRTWVTCFAYVCRTNAASNAKRMLNVKLFSTDDGDTDLANKVERSDYPTEWDQKGTFFYVNTTSLPENGADWYFLYKTRVEFYGNCAELRFYGWDQADIDRAGVLVPPTEVTLESTASGILVSWNEGQHLTGYIVQRRVHGGDEWTDVYNADDPATLAYEDSGIPTAAYEYRVLAKGAGGQTAASLVYQRIFYVPGDGTGLRGVLWSEYDGTDCTKCAPTNSFVAGVVVPNLEFAAGDEFVAGSGVRSNAWYAMTGRLVVPVTGSYTFTLDTADGAALFIDGEWVVNMWFDNGRTGSKDLTAGEHDIELHYRLASAANRAKLSWSGPVEAELVPASQLKPSADAFSFGRGDGWTAHFYRGERLGQVIDLGNGSLKLTAGSQQTANYRDISRCTFCARGCDGSFSLSATYRDHRAGSGGWGLMARAANGDFVRVYGLNGGTAYAVVNMRVLTNGDTVPTKILEGDHINSTETGHLRLDYDRETSTFTSFYRASAKAAWTEYASWNDASGAFAGGFEAGCFIGGYSSGMAQGEVTFSNIVFRPRCGLILLLK